MVRTKTWPGKHLRIYGERTMMYTCPQSRGSLLVLIVVRVVESVLYCSKTEIL